MEQQQLKYKDLLQQSQEEKDKQEIEFLVEEAKQQLESDILATNKSLATNKRKLLQQMSSIPLDSQSIINIQVEIEGLEDGLKRLNSLKEVLF